jgi:hypothetical protein
VSAQSCIVVTIVTGAVLNGWLGPSTIAQKFALWPTPLERLRSDPAEVVVFGKWWMPEHMAGITAAKQTFLAADTDALGRLSSALLAHGVTHVSYKPKSLELPLVRGTCTSSRTKAQTSRRLHWGHTNPRCWRSTRPRCKTDPARDGNILMSAESVARVSDDFLLENIGEHSLKNVMKPIPHLPARWRTKRLTSAGTRVFCVTWN